MSLMPKINDANGWSYDGTQLRSIVAVDLDIGWMMRDSWIINQDVASAYFLQTIKNKSDIGNTSVSLWCLVK